MKRKNESGVVVVEALIVVTIVVMFITVMLYLGMILYQQSVVNIMANQTASSIAQIYGNTLRDPFTGYVDADGVHETVTYANMRNQAYYDVIKEKANALAMYRLKSSRILNTGTTEVDVEIVPKKNELMKDQVVVTVSETYQLSLISFFGVDDDSLTFVGTGRADCTDLLDYLIGVPALGSDDDNTVIFREDLECTVNFYKHYGDMRPYKTVTVLQGYSVNTSTDKTYSTMPERPSQEKMQFVRWITEDGHTFNGGSTVNTDMSVYGVWECSVVFDPDGGTVTPTSMVATVGGNITLPVPQRENCTFAGWYTEKNGRGEEFTGINVQSDITVYAKWLCTVTFNPDGGEVSPDSVDVICGSSLSQDGHTLPVPTRTGCTFDGWFTEYYGEGESFSAGQPVQGHITVVAKWNCVVRFLDMDGTELFSAQTVVAGRSATMQDPTRPNEAGKGWQFLGWKDGSGTFYDSSSIITASVDLYAQWNCIHVYEYNRTIKEATCIQHGICIMKCKYCGDEKEELLREFGAHQENEGKVTNAGCTSDKVVTYSCKNCNAFIREVTSEASWGHDFSGNCGQKHYLREDRLSEWWGATNEHPRVSHYVQWKAHIVCVRCGADDGYACGTCFNKWPNSETGWGQWKKFVDIHEIGEREFWWP